MAWTSVYGFFLLDGKIIGEFNKHENADIYPTHPSWSVAFADWIPAALIAHGADDYVIVHDRTLRGYGFTRTDMRRNADDTDYIVHSIDAFDTIAPNVLPAIQHGHSKHLTHDAEAVIDIHSDRCERLQLEEDMVVRDTLRLNDPDLSPEDRNDLSRCQDNSKKRRNAISDKLTSGFAKFARASIGKAMIDGLGLGNHGEPLQTAQKADAVALLLVPLITDEFNVAGVKADGSKERNVDDNAREAAIQNILTNLRADFGKSDSDRIIPKNLEVADLDATYTLLKTASGG